MSKEEEECCGCGSTELSEISYHFAHNIENEQHLMCKKCLIEFTKVCTCYKEFKHEPKTLMVYCPCNLDQDPTKTYHPINTGFFLDLLEKLPNKEYYFITGCRGCKYTEKEICNDFNVALKTAVEACIYERTNQGQLSMMAYISDALDSNFIKAAKDHGIDLGLSTDI